MKKKAIALMITLATTMVFPVTTFASEIKPSATGTSDTGIAPDSVLYTVDKLGESIHLAVTSNPEKEANLIKGYAEERLSESKAMKEKKKNDLVKQTLIEYKDNIKKVTEQLDDQNPHTCEFIRELGFFFSVS